MSIAIRTKFLGPTNSRGARVKAETFEMKSEFKKSIVLPWNYSLGVEGNHTAAAMELAEHLEWSGDWHIAEGGDGYLYVRAGEWSKRFTVS